MANYKIVDGKKVLYTKEELKKFDEIEPVTEEPSKIDRVEAQILYTALMTDTLLTEE